MPAMKAIVIHDKGSDTYTAYVKDYPGVIVQCKDKSDLSDKLNVAWDSFVNFLKSKREFELLEETI